MFYQMMASVPDHKEETLLLKRMQILLYML